MDQIPNSSANNSTDPSDSRIQSTLKSLNKNSYKISKPPPTTTTTTTTTTTNSKAAPNPNPPPNPNQQPQPPVYNIDKNDFREVVQKLTGSPIHHTRPSSSPSPSPPPPPPPPATSRLQRIRPPPLANLSTPSSAMASSAFSPLPPLPTVSTTAESPITAYMRCLRGGGPSLTVSAPLPPSSPLGFGCILPSPRTTAASYGMGMMPPTSPRMSALSPR